MRGAAHRTADDLAGVAEALQDLSEMAKACPSQIALRIADGMLAANRLAARERAHGTPLRRIARQALWMAEHLQDNDNPRCAGWLLAGICLELERAVQASPDPLAAQVLAGALDRVFTTLDRCAAAGATKH